MLILKAIVPKRPFNTQGVRADARRALDSYGAAVIRRMQFYPAWQPWKNPPRSGLRAGGARTGNYGRNWRKRWVGEYGIEVSNPLSYARYVGGPRNRSPGQARALRARGWPSITDVARDEVKRFEPAINRAIRTA